MEESNQVQSDYPSYDNLPDIILLNIINCLDDVNDIFSASRVCTRWNHLTKSYTLWRQRRVVERDFKATKKLVTLFPKSITRLEITHKKDFSEKLPLNLYPIVQYLRSNFCPGLESFAIENASIDYSDFLIEILLHSPNVLMFYNCVFKLPIRWQEQKVDFYNIPLAPKANITVLDLTNSKNFGHYLDNLHSFCSFPNLQELYLTGSDFDDYQISSLLRLSNSGNLRILDIENTTVGVRFMTIFELQKIESLTTLYMGHTCVTNLGFLLIFDNESFLPHLKTLCIKNSRVTGPFLEDILSKSKRNLVEISWSLYVHGSEPVKECNHFKIKPKCCFSSCHIEVT